MSNPRSKQLKLLFEFFDVLSRVENKSYFDLPQRTKQIVKEFETAKHDVPHIEAWSFVPHPAVIEEFAGPNGKLERHILTIDTQKSSVYGPVREFLETQNANVSSYYSGGWADFLCDVQMDHIRFNEFLNSLRAVLVSAKAERFCSKALGVNALISIFKVEEPLVVCGKILQNLARPDPETLKSVLKERVKFEMALRDYRSPDTATLFGTAQELQKYLRKLKAKGVIVCFRVVTDFSRFSNFDYIPFGTGHRVIGRLLDDARDEPKLLSPVRELFRVAPTQTTDAAETEVTHMFINQYPLPGDRKDWKRLVYTRAEVDVNLYNYPLEGPINESPIYLSDLPEFLARAKSYSCANALVLGSATHPMMKDGPPVCFTVPSLARHGVTLGDPGTGKTNADLLLVCEGAKYLETIVVLDNSGGVNSKLDTLPSDVRGRLTKKTVGAVDEPKRVMSIIEKAITEKAISLVEIEKESYARIVDLLLKRISNLPDLIKANRPREIRKMLIIEEAADLFGSSNDAVRERLVSLLDHAYRKGWCVWLSLQRPTDLGSDARKLLKNLANKIVYKLKDQSEVTFLVETLREAGMTPGDVDYLSATFSSLPEHAAFVIGVLFHRGVERLLSPVPVKITYLQPDNGK